MMDYYYDFKNSMKCWFHWKQNSIVEGNAWLPHRLRHFYMGASNSSASTSTTTQRTCCYSNSTEYPEVRPNILIMACKQLSTPFWRPRTTTLTIGMLLDFSIKNVYILKYTFFNTNVKSKSGSKFSYAFKQFNSWFAFIEYECKRPVNNDRK